MDFLNRESEEGLAPSAPRIDPVLQCHWERSTLFCVYIQDTPWIPPYTPPLPQITDYYEIYIYIYIYIYTHTYIHIHTYIYIYNVFFAPIVPPRMSRSPPSPPRRAEGALWVDTDS